MKNLRFYPFRIPHDASETVAFRIETTDGVIGFATDIGATTDELIEQFRDCLVLVVESNHATELLRVSPYDSATRSRIASVQGHLSNESLAVFVRQHLGQSVRCIVLAHLSRVNNVPEIAALTCREALAACGRNDVDVVVSSPGLCGADGRSGYMDGDARVKYEARPPGSAPILKKSGTFESMKFGVFLR